MNSIRTQIQSNAGVVVAVLLACGAALVALWLLSEIVYAFLGLDKALASTVIVALVTLFSVLFTYWKERKKALREAHREKKIEVYSIFFDLVFSLLRKTKSAGRDEELPSDADSFLSSSDFLDKYFELIRGVTFYGSPAVIDALCKWKREAGQNSDDLHAVKRIGAILLAMREDIGLSNSGLTELSIHQIYVNDDLRTLGEGR